MLAGGVGMLMMAAVKSCSLQFSFRSPVWAFRLERLRRHKEFYLKDSMFVKKLRRTNVHVPQDHKTFYRILTTAASFLP